MIITDLVGAVVLIGLVLDWRFAIADVDDFNAGGLLQMVKTIRAIAFYDGSVLN